MLTRIDKYRLVLPADQTRKVEATVYLSESMHVEKEALQQLADCTTIDPDARVLATPDIHTGFGVPIGSVFASAKFVSPCAVGYDINCGMRLLTTPLCAGEVDVVKLAESIRRDIPLGEGRSNISVSGSSLRRILERGVPEIEKLIDKETELQRGWRPEDLYDDLLRIEDGGCMDTCADAVSKQAVDRGHTQLGTLGGGNHFIELQRVERIDDLETAKAWGVFKGQLVVMIHSGSRGLGHQVGGEFMTSAAKYDAKHGLPLPNSQLAYFPIDSPQGRDYMAAMKGAANFAFANRQMMAQLVRHDLRWVLGEDLPIKTVYDVPHNIAKFEEVDGQTFCVHRKGATRAFPGRLMKGTPFEQTGQPVLIPGSMGTASYLLAGVESGKESLYSVNHGAGRTMSRTEASGKGRHGKRVKAAISDERFKESMKGIHLICSDRSSIKEEAPDAYKDIDAVIETVVGAGLARIVARMVPLAVMKG